ncbi:hypothetical protein CLU96_1756 [Chryseobacterium sp. 52]|uniref:hypothetical protein n=1 Tax=Chryseobacterium sp. 52 TaxID=2035213 RepID=UPI000C174B71|nr:hypothetical protein [Chryseobacterium sp. 52]PIF44762.1 hypothetical protein CLU96_1756 [Chryseobacterium sp. 52]
MDELFYKQKFQEAVDTISRKEFDDARLRLSVDVILESVALKIYKTEWSSNPESPLDAPGRIFFSVWINEKSIQEGKIYYNIHALKLRDLKPHKIPGRGFAEEFRKLFKHDQQNWENVNVQYGPLTLMEGWIELQPDQIQNDLHRLARKFLMISPMIDDVLDTYRLKP